MSSPTLSTSPSLRSTGSESRKRARSEDEDLEIGEEETTTSTSIEHRLKRFRRTSIQDKDSDSDSDPDQQDDKDVDEETLFPALIDIIDLTNDEDERPRPQIPVRNPAIPPELTRETYEIDGICIKTGSTVEILEQPSHLFKASFLYVKTLIEDAEEGILLRGIPLTRARNLRGRLPRLRNEVAMILHVDNDDKRPEEEQACIEVSINQVIRGRICHLTNADFPQHRVESSTGEENGPLMCRWRCIFLYRDALARLDHRRQKGAPQEYVLEHVTARHLSRRRFKVSETAKFNAWRGAKVRGGDYDAENGHLSGPIVPVDESEDSELVMIEKKRGQRYTFGDMFCGAGGASLGARKAGFRVKIACDHHVGACHTHRKVFPECELDTRDIFDFIEDATKSKIRVDVLHLSPPCQFWSPAHTVEGVNDDANIAVLFSCRELIKKLRPRLFTLEQTFGIMHPKFEYYFNALLHGFTDNNYSVRWKCVNLVDWGAPANRKRLIMIGSCPGEELPTFPEPTHANNVKGKKPYITVKRMLARIPRGAYLYDDLHRPAEMKRKILPRWDPDVTLARCITTNGGYGNYHPNGRRDFTLREYATLQTFPVDYPFHSNDRKKQIGNAFPPLVVKALYSHLRKWLERQDRVFAVENEPVDLDNPDIPVFDVDAEISDSSDGTVEYLGSRVCSRSQSYSSSFSGSGGESCQDDTWMGGDGLGKGEASPVFFVDLDQDQDPGQPQSTTCVSSGGLA
ncbi:S-adenosyl-L-methionine-dependent methyltransferase [Poronia punctata]|nr:S-adenosyl-L-methionine-dependent methyltransferase [Poronia punctata]